MYTNRRPLKELTPSEQNNRRLRSSKPTASQIKYQPSQKNLQLKKAPKEKKVITKLNQEKVEKQTSIFQEVLEPGDKNSFYQNKPIRVMSGAVRSVPSVDRIVQTPNSNSSESESITMDKYKIINI